MNKTTLENGSVIDSIVDVILSLTIQIPARTRAADITYTMRTRSMIFWITQSIPGIIKIPMSISRIILICKY
jgi:hypothetical protein